MVNTDHTTTEQSATTETVADEEHQNAVSTPKHTLLSLPPELRTLIYRFAVFEGSLSHSIKKTFTAHPRRIRGVRHLLQENGHPTILAGLSTAPRL